MPPGPGLCRARTSGPPPAQTGPGRKHCELNRIYEPGKMQKLIETLNGKHYSLLDSTPQLSRESLEPERDAREIQDENGVTADGQIADFSPNGDRDRSFRHKRDSRQEIIIRRERNRIIQPSSRRKLCWDTFNLALMVYCCFEIPYFLAFMPEQCMHSLFETFDVFIDFILLLDCGLTCITAYTDDETGTLITEPSLIRRNYLKGWMPFDVATSLPIDWLLCATGTSGNSLQLFRLLKLLRVVRVIRTARRIEDEAAHIIPAAAFSLAHFIALLLLCAHWCACLLYGAIGSTGCLIPDDEAEPRGSVVCGCADGEACRPWNWLVRYDPVLYSSNSTASHYLAAVYFSIVTLYVQPDTFHIPCLPSTLCPASPPFPPLFRFFFPRIMHSMDTDELDTLY